jgi:hypothetical protein
MPKEHGDTEERNAEIYRRYTVFKRTQSEIAEEFGLSQPRVAVIIGEFRKSLPPIDVEKIRQQQIDLYEEIQRQALEIAALKGAPVTSGKDGDVVRDPDGNEVVRDYAGRIAALNLARATSAELRKLIGADAASKTEVSGAVRYEIVGVDTNDLT